MKSERPTRPTPEQQPSGAWEWCEGLVDKRLDHFELHYGEAFASGGVDTWIPVAVVGLMRKGVVNVEFLINRTDPRNSQIVEAAVKELNFYLEELNEADPWRYLQYHCGTLSKRLFTSSLVVLFGGLKNDTAFSPSPSLTPSRSGVY